MTRPARLLALAASLSACADDSSSAIEDTDPGGTSGAPADPSSPSTSADPPSPTTSTSDPTAADGGSTTGEPPTPVDPDGLGPASFDDDELDPPSHSGTITFEQIGAPGWYPSR